jgi:hypothetical protein
VVDRAAGERQVEEPSGSGRAFRGLAWKSSPCFRGRHTTWRIRCSPARVLVSMDISTEPRVLIPCTYHCTVCDETDQSVCWEQTQAHDDGILQCLQAVLLLASIYDEDEDRWGQNGLRKSVLDGGAARMQLWWDLLLGDVLVVRGEVVAIQAEGAYPNACAHVNLAVSLSAGFSLPETAHVIPVGVEDGLARCPTRDRRILEQRSIRLLFQRCVKGTNGNNKARGFLYSESIPRLYRVDQLSSIPCASWGRCSS